MKQKIESIKQIKQWVTFDPEMIEINCHEIVEFLLLEINEKKFEDEDLKDRIAYLEDIIDTVRSVVG